MENNQISTILENVRKETPLVHNITNTVVTNFTANGLLSLGASPVMANSRQEVADMAKIAGALVLNIGTLDEKQVEAMLLAGASANEQGTPVILDPVGAGATAYRTETARKLLKEVDISVLRGNAAEIAHVVGESWDIKGVDSGEGEQDRTALAQQAAQQLDTTVVITGEEDVITNGQTTYKVQNGHPLLTKVTGTGCLLSSVVGAFTAVAKDTLTAALSATICYGITAEMAAAENSNGPGSFQIELLNQLSNVSSKDVDTYIAFKKEEN